MIERERVARGLHAAWKRGHDNQVKEGGELLAADWDDVCQGEFLSLADELLALLQPGEPVGEVLGYQDVGEMVVKLYLHSPDFKPGQELYLAAPTESQEREALELRTIIRNTITDTLCHAGIPRALDSEAKVWAEVERILREHPEYLAPSESRKMSENEWEVPVMLGRIRMWRRGLSDRLTDAERALFNQDMEDITVILGGKDEC